MNRLKFYKQTSVLFSLMLVLSLFWASCTKSFIGEDPGMQELPAPNAAAIIIPDPGGTDCKSQDYCLWAGKTMNAGSVTVSNDAENLYIKVNATENFKEVAENIKVWVGSNLALLPRAGNKAPVAGNFPFKANATGNSYSMTIPFSALDAYSSNGITCNNSDLYVFVHVDMANGNTAWGGCVAGKDSPRWYFYDSYTTGCCNAGL